MGRFDSLSSRGWAFGAGPVVPATARGPAGDVSVGAQHAAPLPGDIGSRSAPRYAEVVLPVPVPRTYTYLIPADLEPRDRKSTRLNSSHVSISYAVFCLKKKKQTQ